MKVSVVISVKNRVKLFERSLHFLDKQTMKKEDFELVIVDDMSTDDIKGLLRKFNFNLKYIKMDSNRRDGPVFWGPALSNNIGFKRASSEILCIVGPEIIQSENNLLTGYESVLQNQKGLQVFGHVFHANSMFNKILDKKPELIKKSFKELSSLPHAKARDITKDTFFWYCLYLPRSGALEVRGVPEICIENICADDDWFSLCLRDIGIDRIHDFRIEAIHQDHSEDDARDPKRRRRSPLWEEKRLANTALLEKWLADPHRDPVINKNDWGSDNLILEEYCSQYIK